MSPTSDGFANEVIDWPEPAKAVKVQGSNAVRLSRA